MDSSLNVSWLPSYGPEMRGGTANCSVIITDEEIDSPVLTRADTVVVMNRPSLEKFIDFIEPNCLLIIDSDQITDIPDRSDINIYKIPAKTIAEEIGSATIANMVLLGALVKKTGIVSMETLLDSLKTHGKEEIYESNKMALERGAEYIK